VADRTTGPDLTYVKAAGRELLRETVWWATTRHRRGDRRDICLFATRRGGSTWCMELIAANRGVRSMNQPLETLSPNLTLSQALELPRFPHGQITSLSGPSAAAMERFVGRLLDGTLVVNAPTKFWRPGFRVRTDRVLLKITDAKAVIGWFDEHFDVDIVVVTRHPVAQALSCIRNAWTLTSDAYLADPAFCEANLGDAAGRCHDVARSGSELERWVLNWALENVAPLRMLPSHPQWLHVRYENAVTDPDRELERMATALQLDDVEAMRTVLRRPSGSSSLSMGGTRNAIGRGDREAMVNGWRAKVDPADLVAAGRVLEGVGIDPLSIVDRW